MNPPKMPFHIGDYRRDTGHLRTIEHGAYLLLLFHYWATGGLPDDDRKLAAIAGMRLEHWRKIRHQLVAFFGTSWTHKRVDKDLAEAKESYERRAQAGQRGGMARASNATAMLKQNPSNAQATLNHIPIKKERASNARESKQPPSYADEWNARSKRQLAERAEIECEYKRDRPTKNA